LTDLYLLDPPLSAAWFPFGDARPIAELRAGAWLIRERWEAIADLETTAIFAAAHLAGFAEDGIPEVAERRSVTGPALVGRADFAPSGVAPELPKGPARLTHDGNVVGWWVPEGSAWSEEMVGDGIELEGLLLNGAYDLITALEHFLPADTADFTHEPGDQLPDGCLVLGDPMDVVLLGARVEPGVVFDVRGGAVVLEQHVYVRGGTRFEGPVYVGPGTEILGGEIRHCAFGPRCKIRGEIQAAVALGYANKGHEGFVGHSVLGRWVNLGAGTTTSNLKNTYGPIRLQVRDARIETGRQHIGAFFADHAKTAIGTMLETGTVVGAGANVFGSTRPAKFVPPFAWGADGTMDLEGFLKIASRAMPRRQVEFTDAVRAMLTRIHQHATA
jgi:UDP-N-acetylglucosamine diphosphorylase/glucosamine-1-phosphate N-acetyltransferase